MTKLTDRELITRLLARGTMTAAQIRAEMARRGRSPCKSTIYTAMKLAHASLPRYDARTTCNPFAVLVTYLTTNTPVIDIARLHNISRQRVYQILDQARASGLIPRARISHPTPLKDTPPCSTPTNA